MDDIVSHMHTNTPEFQMVFSMLSWKQETNSWLLRRPAAVHLSVGAWKIGKLETRKSCNIFPWRLGNVSFGKGAFWKGKYIYLGGGNSNIFNVHPEPWGRTHFDEHIFQLGWFNRQHPMGSFATFLTDPKKGTPLSWCACQPVSSNVPKGRDLNSLYWGKTHPTWKK